MKTWIVALLALLAGCKDKSPPVRGGDAMAKMAAFRDQMCGCKDAACAKRVSRDMAAWGTQQPDSNPAALGGDDQRKASDLGRQIGECMLRATGGTSVPPASGSAATPPSPVDVGSAGSGSAAPRPPRNKLGLPVECDDYKDAIEKISKCDGIAQSARETLVKGYEAAATRWSSMNDATKATLQTSCAGGLDAVLEIGKAKCGW